MANPVMINYRFYPETPSRREAADPSLVTFKNEYYLFASKCGGYYHSTDLRTWDFIEAIKPLQEVIEQYAPAPVVQGDAIIFLTSWDRRIYKSTNPIANEWTLVKSDFEISHQDPALFLDDDGRLYYYGGCSDVDPIYACEIDAKTFNTIGSPIAIIQGHQDQLGWERGNDYNTGTSPPWIEGAFMHKYKGKYYLEYANPGTSFKGYNDAIYIADSPLGPFTLAKHNPMSYYPEGFLAGAGHGSSTEDVYGNWWHISTQAISVRHGFERRLGIWPAFFDADGELYAWTAYGDWPIVIPDKKVNGPEDLKTGWYILSYKKEAKASSSRDNHQPVDAVNEDCRKWWSATSGKAGEFLQVNLGRVSKVYAIQVNFADEGSTQIDRVPGIYYQYQIQVSTDGEKWTTIVDKSENKEDLPHEYFQLDEPANAVYVKVVNVRCPESMSFSLFGLRVFGVQDVKPPAAPGGLNVRRHGDTRTVTLNWDAVPGAVGYNVRFGLDAKKIYHNYLVYDKTEIDINSLRANQDYWFTVDAFNEGGITEGTEFVASTGPWPLAAVRNIRSEVSDDNGFPANGRAPPPAKASARPWVAAVALAGVCLPGLVFLALRRRAPGEEVQADGQA
jgi:hypothetical protein